MYRLIKKGNVMALSNEDTRNMVLRTVFLPPDLDDQLRNVAFNQKMSKGDLIRALIVYGLAELEGKQPEFLEQHKNHKVKKKRAAKIQKY